MNNKVGILRWALLTIAAMILLARRIVTAMTGNAHFVNPNPKLAAITTAIDELEAAEEAYSNA